VNLESLRFSALSLDDCHCAVVVYGSFFYPAAAGRVLKAMALFLGQRSLSTENPTCPICLEELNNRRCLPCLHSFCLGCLERHCKDKFSGEHVLCPLCRIAFQIPPNGLDDLKDPTDVRDGEKTCEVCSTEQDAKPATVYCVNCGQLLCQRCSLPHKKMPGGAHIIRQIAQPNLLDSGVLARCNKHAEEMAELYCFDCKVNVCARCFADSHKQHRCEKVMAAAYREVILQIETESRKLLDSVKTLKKEVKERGDVVKRVVDGHVKDLLGQLDEIESDALKEADDVTETVTQLALAVTSSGADHRTGVQRTPNADELLMVSVLARCAYRAPHVAFIPTDIDELTRDGQNTVGSVLKSASAGN